MTTTVEISCVEAWQKISEMIDQALDPETHERMELHVKSCAHCKAIYDGTKNTVQLVGDEQIFDLPAGFSDRLYARLSSEFYRV